VCYVSLSFVCNVLQHLEIHQCLSVKQLKVVLQMLPYIDELVLNGCDLIARHMEVLAEELQRMNEQV